MATKYSIVDMYHYLVTSLLLMDTYVISSFFLSNTNLPWVSLCVHLSVAVQLPSLNKFWSWIAQPKCMHILHSYVCCYTALQKGYNNIDLANHSLPEVFTLPTPSCCWNTLPMCFYLHIRDINNKHALNIFQLVTSLSLVIFVMCKLLLYNKRAIFKQFLIFMTHMERVYHSKLFKISIFC